MRAQLPNNPPVSQYPRPESHPQEATLLLKLCRREKTLLCKKKFPIPKETSTPKVNSTS